MTTPIIHIQNLHKTYQGSSHPSVDGLSLQVDKGMFFGLLGPNGAGKTTIISILCGLLSYEIGQVKINNLDVRRNTKEIKPLIGVVPQDIALYQELTVIENLQFFSGMYKLSKNELKNRIDKYLQDFGLTSHCLKKISCLSGGMKRQVNLITALLHEPTLLFLDEPTVGVDVHSRQTIIENLKSLYNRGMTIIYTSHDMKEAEQLCTNVVLINNGKIVSEGIPNKLFEKETVSSLEELFIKKTTPK